MDKSTFEKLIVSGFEISHTEAILLEDLLEAFPYCQSAHLLVAKDSQLKKSMFYPKKLRKASAYVLNRSVLHRFLVEKEPDKPTPTVTQNIPPQKTILEDIENTIREIKAHREQIAGLSTPDVALPLPDPNQNKPPLQLKDNFKIATSESRLGDEVIQTTSQSSIELFISYLNNEGLVAKPNTLPKQDEIINKFIETEPKITRSITNSLVEEKTQDLSIKSTELKTELVTENYALILLKQNKIEKAKDIYKKLMLKYPNKSAYFEAKLNEI